MYPDTIDFTLDEFEDKVPVIFVIDYSDPIEHMEPINIPEVFRLFPEPDLSLTPLADYRVRYRTDPQPIWKLADQESKIRRQKRDRIFV